MSTSNTTCPRCGRGFHCGAADTACACAQVRLTESTRQRLRAQYQGCLCVECLRDCECEGARQDAVADAGDSALSGAESAARQPRA